MANAEEARKLLSDCEPDKEFWICDNRRLKSLKELAEALRSMDENVFAAHSNREKKDFSNWVHDVIGDNQLAQQLATKDKNKALIAVLKRIQQLNSQSSARSPSQKARPKKGR